MYILKKEGKEVTRANTLHFVRMQENGAYGLCDRRKADGAAADHTVYLFGTDIDSVEFADGVAELREANEILNIILEGE